MVTREGVDLGTIVFTRFPQEQDYNTFSVAWISMVLVDQEYRGQGIGLAMFSKVMGILDDPHTHTGMLGRLGRQGVDTIRLDATEMGQKLYSKFGFQEEYELTRFICNQVREDQIKTELGVGDIDALALSILDYRYTSTNRFQLIEALADQPHTITCCNRSRGGKVNGYVIMRPGRIGWQVGPCVVDDPVQGISLLDRAMKYIPGQKAIIDIPTGSQATIQWAIENQFVEERRFIRMYYGHPLVDQPENILASFGPEKG